MDNLQKKGIIILVSLFSLMNLLKHRYGNLLSGIVIFSLFYYMNKNIYKSLTISIVITVTLYLSSKNESIMEGLKNKDKTNKKVKKNKKQKKQKQKKTKKTKEKSFHTSTQKKLHNDEKEPYIDVGTNFMKAYEQLTPDQIEGMTKDTQSLISTQKGLMKTLQNLGPTLKEGKNILDTFKNYFDDGELTKK